MPTCLGQHSRDLVLGQALHQLPQLIALGAHVPESTAQTDCTALDDDVRHGGDPDIAPAFSIEHR